VEEREHHLALYCLMKARKTELIRIRYRIAIGLVFALVRRGTAKKNAVLWVLSFVEV
jgi:phage gp36-like protein